MEILISVIAKIAEYTVQPVGRELGYVCFIHANFQKLKTQVEKLKDTRGSVKDKVLIARRNAEDIKPVVEKWLSEVDDFVGTSEGILANEGGHGRLCSTNFVQRHKLSRKARKMADKALQMKNEGESFDAASYKVGVSSAVSSLPKVLDFLNFDSRKSTMDQIMDALLDDNVHRIGVYGMGGVGKTMLVKEITRKLMENKSFDEVVTSTVSQTPDLKCIQGQLADKLGLKFEQETIEGRALMLQKRLKMERSILVVLDDVWEYIDLETIGIPNTVEDHTGCKILFTSRDKHLISNEMRVNKFFEVKVLGEDESWDLFETMVGEIDETCDLEPIAIQIVRECGGLPIAITTVAKALQNKPSLIWKDALDQLKRDDVVVKNIKRMNKEVYSSLKLSYDYLEGEEARLLFLLCSMYQEDFNIYVEDLLVCAMAMGFLHGVETVAQGRRRITTLVDNLISSSLLLQSELGNYDYVKMHDLVRDVAISIASQNDHIRTLCYVKKANEEWKEEKLWGNHNAVSLIIQDLHDPLLKPMLPKVQLLTIDGPYGIEYCSVVETFFEEMKELKGLKLQRVAISLLPPSIHSFANIRLLHLCSCQLGSIDMIGELKKLEILDFSGSNIVKIPSTISQLTQLKVLNLSSCYDLKVIPPNTLSKLTKLEELYLETFDRWEGREERHEGKENASVCELRYLPHLYALNLNIQDEEIMPKDLFSGALNLEKFNINIGCERNKRYYDYKKHNRRLSVKMESGSRLDDWIKMLLKKSESVHLVGSICSNVLQLELLDANDFLHLKHLYLCSNLKFQHFIHEKNMPLRKCLSKLEHLHLEKLENLESVIDGYGGEFPFNKLRNVTVQNCKKLETLFFNCNILDDILNLEEIDISSCVKMEVMITVVENDEQAATNHIEFTHLKSLRLWGLPRLQKFCSKTEKNGQLSGDNPENPETSTINNDIGRSFFSEQVSLPNLEKIFISDANNLKMIWSNVLIHDSFSKLKKVEIFSCNNLEKVFPSNMMITLTCLNILKIKECQLLKGIFEVQEPCTVSETSLIVLRNLRHLELDNLPYLEYVWSKNPCELLSFVNMETCSIKKCSRLKREYSVKILKQVDLASIDIKQLMEVIGKEKSGDMLESKQLETSKVEVIKLGDGSKLFPKLTTLELYGFVDYTSTHLPMEIVQILNQLQNFKLEGAFIEEISPSEILIPIMNLGRLTLSKLPKLRHLWSECSQNNTPVLQHLYYLSVSECGALSSLMSSSVSFTNLEYLYVSNCHGLNHLLNPPVARTLVQLQTLILTKCKRMSTVIHEGEAEEEGNDEIVFNNIQYLHLYSCSEITSFYCGRCIIKFPRLRYVHIRNCPEMKMFSHGIVSTPHLEHGNFRLYTVNDTWYDLPKDLKEKMVELDINLIIRKYWEDTIDTNISYLFEDQVQNLEESHESEYSSSDVEE